MEWIESPDVETISGKCPGRPVIKGTRIEPEGLVVDYDSLHLFNGWRWPYRAIHVGRLNRTPRQSIRFFANIWTRGFPILGTYNKRIVYVDGFSGPGRYKGGEHGSPVIAMESAKTHRASLSGEIVFLFIEEHRGEPTISIPKSSRCNFHLTLNLLRPISQ